MALWSDGAGVAWNTWGNHWPVDLSTTAALALTTPVAATINWRNITNPVALASSVVTPDANINERWRVEPAALPSSVVTPDAQINWRKYTITTPLAAMTTTAANINWRNYTSALALTGQAATRTANINLRWRVEPVPLGPLMTTHLAYPGDYIFSGDETTTTALALTSINTAFIKQGPWAPTDYRSLVDVGAEDRVISIKAEDRSIQVQAEDRTITIRT